MKTAEKGEDERLQRGREKRKGLWRKGKRVEMEGGERDRNKKAKGRMDKRVK